MTVKTQVEYIAYIKELLHKLYLNDKALQKLSTYPGTFNELICSLSSNLISKEFGEDNYKSWESDEAHRKNLFDAVQETNNKIKAYKQSYWYTIVPRPIRIFLGIISLLLLAIPAILVHQNTKEGFTQTFFGRSPKKISKDMLDITQKLENELGASLGYKGA